jgi:hypothetical protein
MYEVRKTGRRRGTNERAGRGEGLSPIARQPDICGGRAGQRRHVAGSVECGS